MKASKSLLGILTITAALLGTVTLVNAESFIGPTSSTNRFIIGTNESVLIDTVLLDANALFSPWLYGALVVSNITYNIQTSTLTAEGEPGPFKVVPYAIPGPAELILSNSCIIHLTRLTNSSVQMIKWANSNTVTVTVPTGKTIQFFWPIVCTCTILTATLSSGTQSFDVIISPGDLIQGPITVSFDYSKQYPQYAFPNAFVSYWFVENVFQNPNTVLSLGAGVPNVLVLKSANLNNWQPVATFPVTLGSNSFYRLQISQ